MLEAMSSYLPPYIIALCGCLFILLGLFYPTVSRLLGAAAGNGGQRLLSIVLGLALLGLWGIWYSIVRS